MLGKMVVVASNAIVCRLNIICIKGWFTSQERENYDADCPYIDFEGVTPLRLEQFRRQIVWSATKSFLRLSFMVKFCGQSKISNLDLHLAIEK